MPTLNSYNFRGRSDGIDVLASEIPCLKVHHNGQNDGKMEKYIFFTLFNFWIPRFPLSCCKWRGFKLLTLVTCFECSTTVLLGHKYIRYLFKICYWKSCYFNIWNLEENGNSSIKTASLCLSDDIPKWLWLNR